ncbi:MAG TPA: arylesterase [Hypericibacter adhaerens]|uniref:Arylesterase n=1 Tax=Hypericibacter adhaerens TaxID=2602016 RepID=A0A5J6N4X5_9PROT|nr:arylesterase [Hypericibacter adhaerens]QEX24988.1 arylesterase [Hypericibacter adhaerens]HWA43759.1 arylesterase [Hypericibacter adhaerens]
MNWRRLSGVALLFLVVSLTVSPARAENPIRILALGDSLTSGYGLADRESFPSQLEQALIAAGEKVALINGGVAGDTSAGGLARLDWSLADKPAIVILEFGANDGLRGLDPAATRRNLAAMLTRLTQDGIPTLLVGMKAPRNLGADYVAAFDPIYEDLAKQFQLPLDPFFLDGVAGDPALNQSDGIHPNAAGVAVIVKRIAPEIIALIKARKDNGSG